MGKMITENKYGKYFWYGILIYVIGIFIEIIMAEKFNTFFIKVLGLSVFGFSVFSNLRGNIIKEQFSQRTKIVNLLILFLLLWVIFMYVRAEFHFMYSLFPYGFLSYAGIIMLFLSPFIFYNGISKVHKYFSFFFFCTFILLLFGAKNSIIQHYLETFASVSAVIFLTNKYRTSKEILASLLVLMLAFIVATLTARRNLMVTFFLYISIGTLFYYMNGKIKSLEVKILSVLSVIIFLVFSVWFYMNESQGVFSKITGRATENTRVLVFASFAVDMSNTKDLVLGRGMSGKYYCPGVDVVEGGKEGETEDYRDVIECGYLQWILKGGLIYAVLYVSLFIIGIYRGLTAKNQFLKAMSAILFVQLIDLVPFGLHAFNPKTFIIWMALAFCLNKTYREMDDETVQKLISIRIKRILPWEK